MVAVTLALVEMGSIFAAVCAMVFVGLHPLLTSSTGVAAALTQAFVFSLSWVVAFHLNKLYDLRMVPGFAQFARRLPASCGLALILLAGSYLLLPPGTIAGGRLICAGLISVALVLPLRAVSYAVIRRRRRLERLLILGTSPLASKLIKEIEAPPHRRFTIVGVLDDAENLGRVIETTGPDCIVVALAERRGRLPLCPLVESLARGMVVEDVAETYERLTGKLALEALSPSSVIFSRDFRPSRFQRALSLALGLLVSVIGLIVLAPVFGMIALLIKLDSRGPAFFVQERVGLSGRTFMLIKFRTMRPVSGPRSEWERDNRTRITRLGRWLRRFRLDELPQLLNVLRRDMNLIGPRPHPVTNLELMILAARNLNELTGDAIPYYSLRCAVRPGITGWAQIRYGYANGLDEETEKLRYDLYYMKHMSLWLDLRILFETAKIVFLGRRSATAERQAEDRAARQGEPDTARSRRRPGTPSLQPRSILPGP